MTEKLKKELLECAAYVNSELYQTVNNYRNSEIYTDEMSELVASAEYSLLAGGKRLRPFLCMYFCYLCGKDARTATPLAIALEMIHTYSLIHDDLPCMDNDDLRRGRPTNHKVYGEATALLAGDALLTEAFNVIASSELCDASKVQAIKILSEKAGMLGMIGGQEIDLKSEGKRISLETLYALQGKKTGMLFEAACQLGCIAAGCYEDKKFKAASEFAKAFGIAFQITDDILDVTGSSEELGKNINSDEKSEKSTTVSHLGLEGARLEAERYTDKAKDILTETFGGNSCTALCDLCDHLLTRRN